MAFSGTLVAAGQATGVVVATGARTEIGRISTLIESVEQLTTPLLRQINRFGRRFTWSPSPRAVVLFAFAVLVRGYAWPDALIAVVALAVGVVPEGLPAVITITLAIGVQRMAARNAVIRRLPAVETLGATSVICSDKTGTLTRNEMTARRIVTAGHRVLVARLGLRAGGRAHGDGARRRRRRRGGGRAADPLRPAVQRRAAAPSGRQWAVDGDPMEGALVALAMKAGSIPSTSARSGRASTRSRSTPRTASWRRCTPGRRGERGIFVKGAPERLLAMCASRQAADGEQPSDRAYWAEQIAQAASEGERVLGFAREACRDRPGTALVRRSR